MSRTSHRFRIYAWSNNHPEYLGRAYAPTFDEACTKFIAHHPEFALEFTRTLYPTSTAAKKANNVR